MTQSTDPWWDGVRQRLAERERQGALLPLPAEGDRRIRIKGDWLFEMWAVSDHGSAHVIRLVRPDGTLAPKCGEGGPLHLTDTYGWYHDFRPVE